MTTLRDLSKGVSAKTASEGPKITLKLAHRHFDKHVHFDTHEINNHDAWLIVLNNSGDFEMQLIPLPLSLVDPRGLVITFIDEMTNILGWDEVIAGRNVGRELAGDEIPYGVVDDEQETQTLRVARASDVISMLSLSVETTTLVETNSRGRVKELQAQPRREVIVAEGENNDYPTV